MVNQLTELTGGSTPQLISPEPHEVMGISLQGVQHPELHFELLIFI